MSLHFRRATLADAPALAANHLRAYPNVGATLTQRIERFQSQKLWPLDSITIAERDGAIVGQARTMAFRGWLGGRETRVGGLAGVAVAPEARRTGVAAALCREHLSSLRAGGTAWSFLYPFAPTFYARLGWRPVARLTRWRFPPRALPLYPERRRVLRIDLRTGEDFVAVQACYATHCQRVSGSLSRSDEALVDMYGRDEQTLAVGVRGAGGGLDGYLLYRVRAPEARPQTLVVDEFVALDATAEHALLGFLSAQSDQADTVLLDTPVDHPIASLLTLGLPESQTEMMPLEHLPVGTVYQGLMARIVDLPGALVGRGYPGGSGMVAFNVRDREIAVNEALVTLVVENGAVKVQAGRRPEAPLIRGDVGDVARVLTGGMRLWDAARMGCLEVEGDLVVADALLALPVPFPLVVF